MSKKKEPAKLDAGPEFDGLMSKLAQVPKSEAERAESAWRKAKKRKRDRKNKGSESA